MAQLCTVRAMQMLSTDLEVSGVTALGDRTRGEMGARWEATKVLKEQSSHSKLEFYRDSLTVWLYSM